MTLGRISFGPLLHQTLGFENFLRDVEKMLGEEVKTSTFPHHNIIKVDDNRYIVELAVAGFSEEDLEVIYQDGTITIKGEKKDDDAEYIHKGIATRKFTREFILGSYLEVTSANLDNGVLSVSLERNLPESMKPRQIEILRGTLADES